MMQSLLFAQQLTLSWMVNKMTGCHIFMYDLNLALMKIIVFRNCIRILMAVSLLSVSGCTSSQSRRDKSKEDEITMDKIIEYNRRMVDAEQKAIGRYVEENKLNMQPTKTGLWYILHENGSGDKIVKGQIVTLNYEICLLDGTVCYSSTYDGPKVFQVGKGGVESGLEEGILLLREGSKATFIMPPHLAHGLVGDDDRIPSRAILKYDVEVVNVGEK